MGFRTDVQGLRGVAVFSVVFFHTGYLPSGFIGVDMFLVISGFVVTRELARALAPSREATAHVILGFYKKRVARLLPAVALVAGPVAVAALVLGPMSAPFVILKTVIAGLLLMSNGFRYRDSDYFSVGSEGNPFLHLWSLSVGEQLCLVFPFVLATRSVATVRLAEDQGTLGGHRSLAGRRLLRFPSRRPEVSGDWFARTCPKRRGGLIQDRPWRESVWKRVVGPPGFEPGTYRL